MKNIDMAFKNISSAPLLLTASTSLLLMLLFCERNNNFLERDV